MRLTPRPRGERIKAKAVLEAGREEEAFLDWKNLVNEEDIQLVKKFGQELFQDYNSQEFDSELITAYLQMATVFSLIAPEHKKEFTLSSIPQEEIDHQAQELQVLGSFDTSMSLVTPGVNVVDHLDFLHQFGLMFPERVKEIFPSCDQALLDKLDILLETTFLDIQFWIVETLFTLYQTFPEQRKAIKTVLKKHAEKIQQDFSSRPGGVYPDSSYVFLILLLPELRDQEVIKTKVPGVRRELKKQLSRFKKEPERFSRFSFDHNYLYQLTLSARVFEAESAELQDDGTIKLRYSDLSRLSQGPTLPNRLEM